MERTPQAVALMLRVAEKLEAAPHAYDQYTWLENLDVRVDEAGEPSSHFIVQCDTRGCVAGWICVYGGKIDEGHAYGWGDVAADLLGLNEYERTTLFHESWLPKPGMTVAQALSAFAHGAEIDDVTMSLDVEEEVNG